MIVSLPRRTRRRTTSDSSIPSSWATVLPFQLQLFDESFGAHKGLARMPHESIFLQRFGGGKAHQCARN
jgi:hypothetical protein